MTTEQLEQIFTYHAPGPKQQEKYIKLRAKAKELAMLINEVCPESREKSVAITHIQTVSMFANAAIAIHDVN